MNGNWLPSWSRQTGKSELSRQLMELLREPFEHDPNSQPGGLIGYCVHAHATGEDQLWDWPDRYSNWATANVPDFPQRLANYIRGAVRDLAMKKFLESDYADSQSSVGRGLIEPLLWVEIGGKIAKVPSRRFNTKNLLD